MKIILCDTNPLMINAWNHKFRHLENVNITNENIFDTGTEAIVSPANSLGIMRGGFDGILAIHFGTDTEMIVQNHLKTYYKGLLAVGEATVVNMRFGNFDKLIVAPTMSSPGMDISGTDNVYQASKAVFTLLKEEDIGSLTMTGMGTGVGKVSPEDCAKAMYEAYQDVFDK